MPSHLTHNRSYFDVYEKLSAQMRQEYAGTWGQYNIFAQGHDLLLFYMFLHILKFPDVQRKLRIVEDNIQDLVVHYVNALQETGGTAESKLFLYGYLIHHFLDAKLHPLIIYETGDLRSDKKAQALHLLVENMIDAYVLKKDGIDPGTYKIYTLVPSDRALTAETRAIVRISFERTYHIEKFDELVAEYNKMTRRFLKAARYDPLGVKKLVFTPLDYLLMGMFKPSILPFRFDGTEALEYLNKQNEPWTHPVDASIVSTKSFDELYDDGINEISRMISMLDEAILHNATDAQLRSIVPNISSIHGREVRDDFQLSNVKR